MRVANIKINPEKLPKPLLPPSMPCKIDIPSSYGRYGDSDMAERIGGGPMVETWERKDRGNGKMWTYQEEAELLEMHKKGKPIAEIAQALGRTEWSIKGRLVKIRSGGRIVE